MVYDCRLISVVCICYLLSLLSSSTCLAFCNPYCFSQRRFGDQIQSNLQHHAVVSWPVIITKRTPTTTYGLSRLSSLKSSGRDEIESSTDNEVTKPPNEQEGSTSYPVNLPSPILLGSSIALGIASTGSLFELLSEDPKLGTVPTIAIVVIGIPVTLFLFYASIQKATAETEEDDKRYQGN